MKYLILILFTLTGCTATPQNNQSSNSNTEQSVISYVKQTYPEASNFIIEKPVPYRSCYKGLTRYDTSKITFKFRISSARSYAAYGTLLLHNGNVLGKAKLGSPVAWGNRRCKIVPGV